MDWISGIQNALDYMEENLKEELDYTAIAEKAYSSSFHFQRTFNLLTGMTVGEYIRNRRLSLAGEELTVSDEKIIDLALKYGYDTPESFAKAFTRFHGVTPIQARKKGVVLKSFHRLSIKLIMEGGSIMEYRIEERKSFMTLAKVGNFPTDDVTNHIRAFWDKCIQEGAIKTLCNYDKESTLLGICEPEKKGEKTFRYGIAVECKDMTKAPDGFELWEIPAHTWAVFHCISTMPQSIKDMWKRIYTEFLPQSEYERLDDTDLEVYPDYANENTELVCDIWVPVQKNGLRSN